MLRAISTDQKSSPTCFPQTWVSLAACIRLRCIVALFAFLRDTQRCDFENFLSFASKAVVSRMSKETKATCAIVQNVFCRMDACPLSTLHIQLGGTNLTSRAGGDPENGQKVSLLACVANNETHIKIQFPKTALWGPYFIMFHCQQRNSN